MFTAVGTCDCGVSNLIRIGAVDVGPATVNTVIENLCGVGGDPTVVIDFIVWG